MYDPAQLTTAELHRLTEHAAALHAMRSALPVELFIKLDTFLADLRAEQEDRQAAARHPLQSAGQAPGASPG